ncbi:MAG: diguanylate cyclase [Spirochaetota bacterium]
MNRDNDTVSLKKSVLSRLGVSFLDMRTGEGFADSHWLKLGRTFAEFDWQSRLALIHPDDRADVEAALDRHLRGDTPEFKCEFRVKDADGTYRWFISSGIVERRAEDGTPATFVGNNEDVTNLHSLREQLQDAQQMAEERATEAEALRGAGAVVVSSLDAPTAVRSVIQQLRTLVDYDSAIVCELEDRRLKLVGGSSNVSEKNWREFSRRNVDLFLSVIKTRTPELTPDGDTESPCTLFVPLVVRSGTVGVLAVSRRSGTFSGNEVRVSMSMADYLGLALSNARLYARMQQRAEIDQLTGVLTRRAFMETGEQVVDAAFHGEKPLCCIVLDLDHFKSINDTYGHPAGDQVLRRLGAVMRDSLRSTDVIGRFGGEEFCALLTETKKTEGLEVAERLRTEIEATSLAGVNRTVTASIGIACLRHVRAESQDGGGGSGDERLSIEQLIKRADDALYAAKSGGRNRVVQYEHGMTSQSCPTCPG